MDEEERYVRQLWSAVQDLQSTMEGFGWKEGSRRMSGCKTAEEFEMLKVKTGSVGALLQGVQSFKASHCDTTRLAEVMLKQVQYAARFHCQRFAREEIIKQRLRRHGLLQSVDILTNTFMIDRLHEAAVHNSLLSNIGLPSSEELKLQALIGAGEFSEERVTPSVPAGYVEVQSRSCLLWYLRSESNIGDAVWDWPPPQHSPQHPPLQQPCVTLPPISPEKPLRSESNVRDAEYEWPDWPEKPYEPLQWMPRVHEDFPWFIQDQNGIIEKNGNLFCHYCGFDITSVGVEEHLSLERKAGREHGKKKEYFFEALGNLRTDGWKFFSEGIHLKDMEYYCKPCDKRGPWWDLFNTPPHIQTKRHIHSRNQGGPYKEIPDVARHWSDMFADLDARGLQACKECAKIGDGGRVSLGEPSPKKVKTDEGSSACNDNSASFGTSSKATMPPTETAGGKQIRLPTSACGYNDAPDETTIDDATKKAQFRYMPPLPHNTLVWGYFRKPNLWMWCTECKTYTAIIAFNAQNGTKEVDNGACHHYDNEAQVTYDAELEKQLKW